MKVVILFTIGFYKLIYVSKNSATTKFFFLQKLILYIFLFV